LACPKLVTVASTHPRHKHIPPDTSTGSVRRIKHYRAPAPDLSFTRPNLPFLIEEIEQQILQQSEA